MGSEASRALNESVELGGWRSNGAGTAWQQHSFLLSETLSLQAGHATKAAHTTSTRSLWMTHDLRSETAKLQRSFLPSLWP